MKRLFVTLLACIAFFGVKAQTYTLSGNEVQPGGPVLFETGSATLKPESDAVLQVIKKYLEEKTYISLIRIEGHVDGSTSDQALSEARANAVAQWLIGKGIDCKRLIPVGFGHSKPISENHAENNRISFVNAMLRGRAIGGMPVDGGGMVAGDPCK